MPVPKGEVLKEITIPRIVFDLGIINAAKLKTHLQTGVSLGMKNLTGLLPEKWKFRYHLRDINKVIVDVTSVLRPKLTVIDGFYALEGPGPSRGTPVKMDILVAGADIVAIDATVCRVTGIDPSEIYHIAKAYEKGFGEMNGNRIEIIGDAIEEVRRIFRRVRIPGRVVRFFEPGEMLLQIVADSIMGFSGAQMILRTKLLILTMPNVSKSLNLPTRIKPFLAWRCKSMRDKSAGRGIRTPAGRGLLALEASAIPLCHPGSERTTYL